MRYSWYATICTMASPLSIIVVAALLLVGCVSTAIEPVVVDNTPQPYVLIPPNADKLKPGDKQMVIAFCLPGPDLELVKNAMRNNDMAAYTRVMTDVDTQCYDGRYMGSNPFDVTFVRELQRICTVDGDLVVFSILKDVEGERLISWFNAGKRCTPPRTASVLLPSHSA